jgi:hypothetical protein
MSTPLKQMVRKGLARFGLSLIKSQHLSGLSAAQSLFPDASSPPSADYIPDAQIGTAGFSLNVRSTGTCSSSAKNGILGHGFFCKFRRTYCYKCSRC